MKKFIFSIIDRFVKRNFILTLNVYVYFLPKKNKRLKNQISVINTFDQGGGAAKIAYDLSKKGYIDSKLKFFVRYSKLNSDLIQVIPDKKYSFIEEVLRIEALKKGWIEFTGFHGLNLLKDTFFCESKIVHLHNLHGEFLSPAIFKSLFNNKKVIWTLHDESFITGHCSCTLGCERWKTGCGECPDLSIYPKVNFDNTDKVLSYKKKWITKLQPIIVSPSHWLAQRVKVAYPDLKYIEVIPNGINTSIFQPIDKKNARTRLKFSLKNKKIVLFVAEFASANPFKGGDILRSLIADNDLGDVIFITVGGKQETIYSNHISYPYISDENELALLYSSADVLLYPTQADNLPLVVLESMACGTPVIASDLGGIPEIITSSEQGILVKEYTSTNAFKHAILTFLSLDSVEIERMSIKAHKHIKKNFSFEMMVSKYLGLYNQN